MCTLESEPLDPTMLVLIGTAFSTIWKYHWCYIIDDEDWRSVSVFESFKMENAQLISSWVVAAENNHLSTAHLIK